MGEMIEKFLLILDLLINILSALNNCFLDFAGRTNVMLKGAMSHNFLLFLASLYYFFTSSKLKQINEILIQRWNLTCITNTDDF